MLDADDLDVVIYPVQNNPPPYIGDWDANFGECWRPDDLLPGLS